MVGTATGSLHLLSVDEGSKKETWRLLYDLGPSCGPITGLMQVLTLIN